VKNSEKIFIQLGDSGGGFRRINEAHANTYYANIMHRVAQLDKLCRYANQTCELQMSE